MSKQPITPQLTDNAKRIIELGKELLATVSTTQKQIKGSIDLAVKVGALLVAERDTISKELGRGYWQSYYEINFSKIIPLRSGQRYMSLARASGAFIKNVNAKTLEVEQESTDNSFRSGILALDLVPKKETPTLEGEQRTPKPTTHLSVVHRFSTWHRWVRTQPGYKEPTKLQIEQLTTDFKELIDFCQALSEGKLT